MGGAFGFASYGGAVNAVASDATAYPQRGAIFDMACNVGWMNPQDEATHLAWVRAFYKDLFADTGGVPVPGDAYDGTLINHPDTDVADPALNTSGVPWHTLYYGDNYSRLQRVKARWDPRDIFHHALSIRAK
jgi:aclacinomycin oxidase